MKTQISLFFFFVFLQSFKSQNGLCLMPAADPTLSVFSSVVLEKADFNNDGREDVFSTGPALVSPYYNNLVVFLSNGTGSFTASNFTINSAHSLSNDRIIFAKPCDFNMDGKQDIFISTTCDTLFLLRGNGAGSFTATSSFTLPYSPATFITSDFNGDGKPDIAMTRTSTPSVSVLLGNGTGGFLSITNYALASSAKLLVAGDFNNNGTNDIFALTGGPSYFLRGNGIGSFTVTNGLSLVADDVKAVDINSDNKLDLIYTDIASSKLNIIKGNGNFTFGTATSFTVPQIGGGSMNIQPGTLHSADFNKDGKTDIAVLSNFMGISIFQGSGNGSFAAPVNYSVNLTSWFIVFNFIVADINNDGKHDIVALSDNGGSIPYGELKTLINCNTVGINEENYMAANIKLFPNPAKDYLQIEISENTFNRIFIYNDLGQLLREEELENNTLKIGELANGVYSLVLKDNTSNITSKRFVVAR